MSDKEKIDIDELLNSYIDGELSDRHVTEIKRLIAHDEQVARRLRELQKTKELLAALPRAKAPAGLAEDVKKSLHRTAPRDEYAWRDESRPGARNLLVRRLVTAAAMIALVSALGLVVFSIVKPEASERELAVSPRRTETAITREDSVRKATAEVAPVTTDAGKIFALMAGQMQLELKTAEPVSSAKVISKAIYDNGLLDCTTRRSQAGKNIYSLKCNKESIAALLADSKSLWAKSEVVRLAVTRPAFGRDVIVDDVSVEQVLALLQQDGTQTRVAMAQDFAALNRIAGELPGSETLTAVHGRGYEGLKVGKPILTWGRPGTRRQPPSTPSEKEQIRLTIVVTSTEQ